MTTKNVLKGGIFLNAEMFCRLTIFFSHHMFRKAKYLLNETLRLTSKINSEENKNKRKSLLQQNGSDSACCIHKIITLIILPDSRTC